MTTVIILLALAFVIGAAGHIAYRPRHDQKCYGCPLASQCSGECELKQ